MEPEIVLTRSQEPKSAVAPSPKDIPAYFGSAFYRDLTFEIYHFTLAVYTYSQTSHGAQAAAQQRFGDDAAVASSILGRRNLPSAASGPPVPGEQRRLPPVRQRAVAHERQCRRWKCRRRVVHDYDFYYWQFQQRCSALPVGVVVGSSSRCWCQQQLDIAFGAAPTFASHDVASPFEWRRWRRSALPHLLWHQHADAQEFGRRSSMEAPLVLVILCCLCRRILQQ